MKILIKNGNVVTEQGVLRTNLLIEDEVIKKISDQISEEADDEIDADGKYVIPGAVDIHTHMDLDVGIARAIDDFYSGTVAAACGGTTTIVDHMAFGPDGCSPWHQVQEYHRLADGNAVIDYGFHGVLQHINESVLSDMRDLVSREGITSFKIYMTYDHMLEDDAILQVMEYAKKEGILLAFHCENDGMIRHFREQFVSEGKTEAKYHPLSRPAEAEAEAVGRMLCLAQLASEAPVYIVHLSSKAGLVEVREAAGRGQKHFAVETCPQYLLLNDSMYQDPQEGLKAIMAPPLRKKVDQEALWTGLSEGDIQVIATDHCPFTFAKQKQQGASDFTKCPSGAPGVEERLLLMFSEGVKKSRITLEQMVSLCCTEPAKIAGLFPKKGVIKAGSDADLVILDPNVSRILSIHDLQGAADYTCYEGMQVQGDISLVMQRGTVLVKDHTFLGTRGAGRYLKREKSSLA